MTFLKHWIKPKLRWTRCKKSPKPPHNQEKRQTRKASKMTKFPKLKSLNLPPSGVTKITRRALMQDTSRKWRRDVCVRNWRKTNRNMSVIIECEARIAQGDTTFPWFSLWQVIVQELVSRKPTTKALIDLSSCRPTMCRLGLEKTHPEQANSMKLLS